MGSWMPSSERPSMARRTPRTCPAQIWPWATAARSRYSASVRMVNGNDSKRISDFRKQRSPGQKPNSWSSELFRRCGGPRMRFASFLKGEDGHEKREQEKRAVTQDGHARKWFGLGETAAIDRQAESVGANNAGKKACHQQSDKRRPNG